MARASDKQLAAQQGRMKDPAAVGAIEVLAEQIRTLSKQAEKKTPTDEAREQILAALDALGAGNVQEQAITYEGDRVVLPTVMEGNLDSAIELLEQVRDAEEEKYEFNRTFPYRPYDGAAAFNRAMERVFGTTGVGKAKFTMFGRTPPRYITVDVAHDRQIQVPWGSVKFAPLDATFEIGAGYGTNEEEGVLFHLAVEAPRKHRRRIEGFFSVVEDELRHRSIYRGKAINGQEHPGFINPWAVDPEKVVYAAEAERQLNANVWAVIEHADYLRKQHVPLKRAVLLEGPYGSGKTLAGAITAQRAVQHDWTFVLVRKGEDPYMAMQTARLYAPAVVLIEDLDVLSAEKSRDEITRLLDVLDGVQAKGAEVMAVFTTNFVHTIERGVLRPGRIDAVIPIGELDPDGYEKLIKVTIPGELLGKIDYATVSEAFKGFLPAFAVEAAQRSIRYAIAEGGFEAQKITTQNLVDAAAGLRPQLELVGEAHEAEHAVPTMDKIVADAVLAGVEDVLTRAGISFSKRKRQ